VQIAREHPDNPVEQAGARTTNARSSHTAQFYQDETALIEEVSRFIGSTLGAGDAAIVMATQAHRDAIAARLHASGLDLMQAFEAGRYVTLDAADLLTQVMAHGNVDRTSFERIVGDHVRRASHASSGKEQMVAIFGELVALLAADGNYEAAIDLEQCWNELARTHQFTLHCGYSMGVFKKAEDIEALLRICDAHTAVLPLESYSALANEDERLRMIVLLQQKAHALEHEVVARTLADQALRERNEELKAAIAARDEFIAVVAHELRTPVTGLRGHAQLLIRDLEARPESAAGNLAQSLGMVERQADQLSHLVERLLDTSQIESGTLRLNPAPTDLVTLARSAISRQPHSDKHQLVLDDPGTLELPLDPARFEQVITNLLDNAIKFSPDGGTVTVTLRDNGQDGIELSVTDHGLGIPMEQREAVFTRFRQEHPCAQFSGIGLGLFVSRQIVELHGGSVRIEDPEHPGTRVVVTLPRGT